MLAQTIQLLALLLAAFTTSTIAAPAPLPVPQDAPQQSSVYYCVDADWKGKCDHRFERLGSDNCITLEPGVSAFGPDPGFLCQVFMTGVCRTVSPDETLTLQYPGMSNLGKYNDRALSYSCTAAAASAPPNNITSTSW